MGHDGAVNAEALPTQGVAVPTGPWWIGLSSWVLQDGNYTDFVTGERRQFALELGYSRTGRLRTPAEGSPRRCGYSGRDVSYQVTGQLLRSASEPMEDAFVLDFGLRAYIEWMVLDDLEPPRTGDWLTGEITLSVDHFAYMDELSQRPGMPPLIYTWTIEEIQLDPDGSRESWRSVSETRMWDHDGSYRLRCSLEDPEPVASMARTGPRSPYGPLPVPE